MFNEEDGREMSVRVCVEEEKWQRRRGLKYQFFLTHGRVGDDC